MSKLTEAQRRALTNLAEERPIAGGIYGRSAHGGFSGTITSLHRRGFLDAKGDITDAGRLALAAAKERGR